MLRDGKTDRTTAANVVQCLKSKQPDAAYPQMLQEIADAHKFSVTFVDVMEPTTTGESATASANSSEYFLSICYLWNKWVCESTALFIFTLSYSIRLLLSLTEHYSSCPPVPPKSFDPLPLYILDYHYHYTVSLLLLLCQDSLLSPLMLTCNKDAMTRDTKYDKIASFVTAYFGVMLIPFMY